MARGRVFTRGRSDGNRRQTEWSGLAAQGYVGVADAGATLVSSISFAEVATLIRHRGTISLQVTTPGADEDIVGAFGMGMVSSEALAVGVTAMPEPFSDSDWGGWMVWQPFAHHWEFQSGIGVLRADWEYIIDSKAMRKVGPNTALVTIVESFTGAFQIAETVRSLLLLH